LDARDRDGKWFESVVVSRGKAADVFAPPLAGAAQEQEQGELSSGARAKAAASATAAALRASAGGDGVVVHFKVARRAVRAANCLPLV
jgi:hypothetical protein